LLSCWDQLLDRVSIRNDSRDKIVVLVRWWQMSIPYPEILSMMNYIVLLLSTVYEE
jgi:hypothetical protein